MASDHVTVSNITFPDWATIDPAALRIDYDRSTDHLFVVFTGEPRPAVSVVIDDYAVFRVDMDTREVVGVEVEHALSRAVYRTPQLLPLLECVGIRGWRLGRVRRRISPETRKRAAVQGLAGLLPAAHLC